MTAVLPSPMTPQCASSGCPSGPVTVLVKTSPPVPSTRALSVPSPPSATGASTVSASGTAAATPRADGLGGFQSRNSCLESLRGNYYLHNRRLYTATC